MTLRVRLSLAFVAAVLVPLVVGAILVGGVFPHALDRKAGDALASAQGGLASVLTADCARARSTAAAVAAAATASGAGSAAAAVTQAVRDGRVDYAQLEGPNGEARARAGSLPAAVPTTSTGLARLGDCGGRGSGTPYTIAAQAQLTSNDGRALGTVTTALRLDRAALGRLARSLGVELTTVSGGAPVVSTLPPAQARQVAAAASAEHQVRVGDRLVGSVPATAGRPEFVLDGGPLPSTHTSPGLIVAVALATVLLAGGAGWQLARLLTRPLAELSEGAARVAGGDLDTLIAVRSRDEVGRLGIAFNGMTEDLRRYIRALESSRDELRRDLARLGETLSGTHDLDRILDVVLDSAVASVRARAGAVFLLADGGGELVLRVGRGLRERGVTEQPRVPVGLGVTGAVAASGRARHGRTGEEPGGLVLHAGEPPASTVLSVPLHRAGRVVGVLDLYDRQDGEPFDAADLATIETFVGQAGVAVDNVLLHEQAQRLSTTDALTGLANYRYFTMNFGKEIERAARFGRPLTLLMVDVDRFKSVNDEHGHQRGDAVLVELAHRVESTVREVDTLARYGGEEFVLILPETDRAGAANLAERIRRAVADRPFDADGPDADVPFDADGPDADRTFEEDGPDGAGLRVTVSIGAAVFPAHGQDADGLLRHADEALYAAKAAGRDCWRMAPADPANGGLPQPEAATR